MNDLTEGKQFSLTPRTLEEAMKFCNTLAKSSLVPKDFVEKPENILVAIQWGMELGLQPMQSMQSIAVINGRPSLWGDAVIGLVRASGLCDYIYEDIDEGGTKATCRTKRKGDDKEQVRTFTKADAEKAKLWDKEGPWRNYPKRMLQMRARSWCLRDVYPDVLRGIHVAEESQDLPEKDITPTAPASVVEQPQARSAPIADAEVVDKDTGEIKKPAAAERPEGAQAPAPANDAKAANGKPMVEGQLRIIKAKLAHAAMTEMDLQAKFGPVADLKFEQFDEVQAWINERAARIAG